MTRRPPIAPRGGSGVPATAADLPAASERGAAGLMVRRAALEILVRVESHAAFADVMLGHRLAAFTPPDRRLLTRLVLGTLAWRGRLDYELAQLCTQPLEKLELTVLGALRLGLFQMRHLSRVPAHAAVDTAVSLACAAAGRGAGGLVNAVLRRAARGVATMPDRAADEVGYLAVAYSHPRWLVACFIEWFGVVRAEALMAADNEAAPNVMRLNLARGTGEEIVARMAADGIRISSGEHLPETAVLEGAADFDSDSYRAGLFHPQSEASQLVARMLAPSAGATVIDCAAAPGGKTAHLAELADTRGRVVALDLNLRGLKAARDLARRLGHRNILFARADLAAAPPLRTGSAGFVLLDAPCTGTGTLREHPEIRWRLAASDFGRMAELQRPMLEHAAALVRPGGVIVYAVCSLAPQEGPGVVRGFLGGHPEFAIERPQLAYLARWLQGDGTMSTSPERGGLDGFFAARMRRR
ncbi:MAG TPA: 16S rRNA (cytosine(967)-C(5))-methyltransferase RsmB [Candidatus Binataceae bacterium]|nr:16S rRNA (cytosine(967)-C(5))-methyltransferase RsmB [Candidatus Binataceae bacterium]